MNCGDLLVQQGFLPEGQVGDGFYGLEMQAAVKEFQAAAGISHRRYFGTAVHRDAAQRDADPDAYADPNLDAGRHGDPPSARPNRLRPKSRLQPRSPVRRRSRRSPCRIP